MDRRVVVPPRRSRSILRLGLCGCDLRTPSLRHRIPPFSLPRLLPPPQCFCVVSICALHFRQPCLVSRNMCPFLSHSCSLAHAGLLRCSSLFLSSALLSDCEDGVCSHVGGRGFCAADRCAVSHFTGRAVALRPRPEGAVATPARRVLRSRRARGVVVAVLEGVHPKSRCSGASRRSGVRHFFLRLSSSPTR